MKFKKRKNPIAMLKPFLLLFFIIINLISFSQNNYITHIVKNKETLYGISKEYGVTVEDIEKANPQLNPQLKIKKGMELKIPKPQTFNTTNSTKPYYHTVKQGEGLYGIARQYNITVDELTNANIGKTQELKPGDQLLIPGKMGNQENTINAGNETRVVEHTMESGETVYSLATQYGTTLEEIKTLNPDVDINNIKVGDKLKIKTKALYMQPISVEVRNDVGKVDLTKTNVINPLKEKLEKLVMKDAYNVTALLPFMIYKNDQVQTEASTGGEPNRMYQLTEMSTHFYQGMKIALDTLKVAGVSINLNVYDTRKDTAYLEKLFTTEELLNSDLIIGPFYEKTYEQAIEFGKEKKIQIACPVEQSNKSLFNNPYVTKLKASLPTQAEYLAKYIAENYNMENVVLVAGKSQKDKYLADLFEKIYNDSIKNKKNNYKSAVTRYNFASYTDIGGISGKLVGSKKNIIIFPSTDLGLSTSFFTQFNVTMNKSGMHNHEIAIFALENFKGYDNIEVDHKVKYNLHVTSSYFVDYYDENVQNFIRKYREQFKTDPNDFAFMGYDAMLYHGVALKNFGKTHANFYDFVQIPLLHTQYNLKRTDANSGFENQAVYILSYSNYELNKVN